MSRSTISNVLRRDSGSVPTCYCSRRIERRGSASFRRPWRTSRHPGATSRLRAVAPASNSQFGVGAPGATSGISLARRSPIMAIIAKPAPARKVELAPSLSHLAVSPLHRTRQNTSTLSAASVAPASSAMVLRWEPAIRSVSESPRPSMQAPQSRTSPSLAITPFSIRSTL